MRKSYYNGVILYGRNQEGGRREGDGSSIRGRTDCRRGDLYLEFDGDLLIHAVCHKNLDGHLLFKRA